MSSRIPFNFHEVSAKISPWCANMEAYSSFIIKFSSVFENYLLACRWHSMINTGRAGPLCTLDYLGQHLQWYVVCTQYIFMKWGFTNWLTHESKHCPKICLISIFHWLFHGYTIKQELDYAEYSKWLSWDINERNYLNYLSKLNLLSIKAHFCVHTNVVEYLAKGSHLQLFLGFKLPWI